MIKSKSFTYDDFIEKIEKNEPFSFSRYGDGEWNAVFNKGGQNCDGHQYFPEMGKRLKNIVISNPKYNMGLQNMAKRLSGPQIDDLLMKNKVDIEWSNSDILHHASIKGKLSRLFETLNGKNIVMVGPKHLRQTSKLFPYEQFIEVQKKNCWEKYKHTNYLVTTAVKKDADMKVVLFCASMMSNVLVDDMYKNFGNEHFFLDVGSIFEPYLGLSIRSYHNAIVNKK